MRSKEDKTNKLALCTYLWGSVLGIRDPKVHAESEQKNPWKILEYLAFLSLLARRAEEAARCKKKASINRK